MSYYSKSRYYHSSKPLKQPEKELRWQLSQSLLTYFPWLMNIKVIQDQEKYPNELLKDLNFELSFVVPENRFTNNSQLKKAYEQMLHLSNVAFHNYQQQQQQQMQYYLQQQAEYAQQIYNPVGYDASYNYAQLDYNQNNVNYPQNTRWESNQRSSQGYQRQQHYAKQNDRRYQQEGNQRQNQRNVNQNKERFVGEQYQNRSSGEHSKKRDAHQNGHVHHHHHHHHQPPNLPERKFLEDEIGSTSEIPAEEIVVKPEPVVEQSPPPPLKSQPKPTKFSISQIKDFINTFSKQELQKHTNPQILAKTKEIQEWECKEVDVEMKEDTSKYQKKQNKKHPEGVNTATIKTGVRRDEAKQAERLGYKGPAQSSKVMIVMGAKETLQTRQMKEELKKKATDFVGQKLQQEKSLAQVQKDRRQIVFNLNLIVPENLKEIQKDLIQYLYSNEELCKILVVETIKKAWDQPKYASTYAKLCFDFTKRPASEFKFETASKKDKDNPFKLFLIQKVQHSFDQKIDKFPDFQLPDDKDLFLKDFKKKILSNVKFIAELIICKVLKRKIIKYCITQLFDSFLSHYYAFIHDKKIEGSVYDYHYEAIIEFIQNIGEKYDTMDEKEKQKEQKIPYEYDQIRDHVEAVLKTSSPPNTKIVELIALFTGDEYLQLLKFIDNIYMKKTSPRLSALLQNLIQRRDNKWLKHLSVAEGPKKLKDIQEDIEQEEEQEKSKVSKEQAQLEKLDKKVKQLFEGWEMNKNEQQRSIKDILRKNNETAFYLSLLKQVADEKKEKVAKRVTLFPVILDSQKFKPQAFKNAWFEAVKYLVIGGQDFPFCGAAMAKILAYVVEKGKKLEDYHKQYEDEEQVYFSEEIVHKYYFYTKDEAALKIIKPKAKYSGLI